MAVTAGLHILGVRHHGPGSARSVATALGELQPDVVLIEGAPELDALLPLAADPELVPPVAGLVYAVAAPRQALFFPMAAFSPEWVALRWALAHGVPVRFADLPAANSLAIAQAEIEAATAADTDTDTDDPTRPVRDPIGLLAQAAGYDDPERWWEDAIEHRAESTPQRLAALTAAIREVRSDLEAAAPLDQETARREAAMRRAIRAERGAGRIAFVCGAFHAPALDPASTTVAADSALLKGLPKTKVAATWAPWTSGRLATDSGYGAGVTAPGWYHHLFTTWARDPDDVVPGWLVKVARALRAAELPAAPASVIEAARLAETLASVRGRPSVGLAELQDVVLAVLCEGSPHPLQLVERDLVVAHELGSVPASTPMVPLAADLARTQRAVRLTPSAEPSVVRLDLRRDSGRARSVLFHRLGLLGLDWARPVAAGGSTGTFKEAWELVWRPEFAITLIEASVYGTTVAGAAAARVAEQAAAAPTLAPLSELVERCLLADLPDGLGVVVAALAEQTAVHHDVAALLQCVPSLSRTCRYGDVRGLDVNRVRQVVDTIVLRAAIGLRAACSSLDDAAADELRAAIESAHNGIHLLNSAELLQPWQQALDAVAADERIHGTVSGRVNRLLLDGGLLDQDQAAHRMSRRLSPATGGPAAAAWLDGFLTGDALLLLHDDVLLGIVDDWVSRIDEPIFDDLLPLLRRTFSRFSPTERRDLGLRLRSHDADSPAVSAAFDLDRGLPAAQAVARLLGLAVTR